MSVQTRRRRSADFLVFSGPGAPKVYITMFSAPGASKVSILRCFRRPAFQKVCILRCFRRPAPQTHAFYVVFGARHPKSTYFTVFSVPGARFACKFTCKSRFSEVPGLALHVNLHAKHVFKGMNRPPGGPLKEPPGVRSQKCARL